ncbi:outer membrane beta-barrel family protein [Parabacteroides merdae]|nr:outer membrane beta-barrel family protein [Parabacteroides merdae]
MPGGTNHQLNAYYNGKVGNLQIDYNFDYLYNKGIKDQLTTQQPEGGKTVYITTTNHTHSKLLASKIIFSFPLGNGQIDAGSEYTYTRRHETFVNTEQLLCDTDDRINESNTAAFAKYSLQWKRWGMSAGIRYQFTRSDYYQKGVKINEQSRIYNKWLPEASVSYEGEKFQAQLSYGAKMTRPSYYMLASNVQYDDQYTYEGGNPLLQPSIYHNLNLEMIYDWIYFTAGYVHKNNEMLNIDKPYNNNAILFTYANIDKVEEVNAMLSLSPHFGFWEPTYSVSISKQFINNKSLGIADKLEKPIFLFKLNNSFSLPQDWVIGIDYSYNTSGHSGTILVKQSNRLDLRINKSFFRNRLSLNLQANDIFKSSYNTNVYYGNNMNMNIRNYSDSRNFQVSITYRFNYTRSKYKGNGAGEDEKERL